MEDFRLSDYQFGKPRSIEQLIIIRACEDIYTAFCDLTDGGDIDRVMALHTDEVQVEQVGRKDIIRGNAAWRTRLEEVRFCYPNRRVLHTPSNLRFVNFLWGTANLAIGAVLVGYGQAGLPLAGAAGAVLLGWLACGLMLANHFGKVRRDG